MLTVFVIGDVLGAGIYALVGEVAGKVGGAIWTSFLLAGVLAAFTATAYAELVTKYPQAAGAALYANKAFKRPFVTFLIAFAVMCSGVASAATLATAFGGDYLSEFVTLPKILVGVVFLGVLALINFRGIKESVKLNLGLTAIELTGLLLVTAIGLAFILDGGGDPGRALEFKSGEAVPLAMLSGASLAFFALIGFEDSVNVAEETQEPSRIFRRRCSSGSGSRSRSTSSSRWSPAWRCRWKTSRHPTGRCSRSCSSARSRSTRRCSPRSRCSRSRTAR